MRISKLILGIGAVVLSLTTIALWPRHAISPAPISPASAPTTSHAPPAADIMLYQYNAPESPLDKRYEYHWEILRAALERTRPKWGDFRMEPAVFMDERRQTFELKNPTGKLSIMYLGTSEDLESTLLPIRIPVDKNLGGYMVMLIRKENQPKFAAVRTVADLQKFRVGLGLGWLDVDILRADGFHVVTGSSYDGLFDMLANSRFDAFSRAAVEVLDEFAERHEKIPDLAIEQTFLLYYPLPMYFWFSKTPEGRRLADRAEEGMHAMIADGTYDQIFFKYQQPKIDQLHLAARELLTVENPLLKNLPVPFEDKRLWFDPTSPPAPAAHATVPPATIMPP